MLYYSYGANTNIDNMAYRCPKAKVVSSLVLPDYRLVFRGVADIEPANYNQVQGVLWDITSECENSLDIFEGVASGLYRKEYFCIKIGGKVEEVMFYKMNSAMLTLASITLMVSTMVTSKIILMIHFYSMPWRIYNVR